MKGEIGEKVLTNGFNAIDITQCRLASVKETSRPNTSATGGIVAVRREWRFVDFFSIEELWIGA